MKHSQIAITAALLAMMSCITASAKQDEKFYRKACEKVWAMDLPQFDPKADLSDSIFQGASSVRIAVYNGITAEFENNLNIGKYVSTGTSHTHATVSSRIYRVMVKLNDAKAVEYYTDFDIDPKDKESAAGYTFVYTNSAFGARIYKPDGSVTDVDTGEALTVTEGKKDRDAKHKLAIPGLEVGDVLDYFYYNEEYLDEVNMPSITVKLLGTAPTKSYTFEATVSPQLTLEYASYNGAPLLGMIGEYSKDVNHVGFTINDLPSIDSDMPFFYSRRQMPYVKVLVLNNSSRMLYHPKTARRGGVNTPMMAHIMADAGHSIADTSLPEVPLSNALKLARQWHKAHPEATEHQLIDAAWMALYYTLATDKRSFSDRAASVYFVDMLKKLKIKQEARFALATSRSMPPINHLVAYTEPYYGVLIGDSLYMTPLYTTMLPGQVDALISGEEIAVFQAERTHPNFSASAATRALPTSRALQNTTLTTIDAVINPDDENQLDIDCKRLFKGASKKEISLIVLPNKQLEAYEDYLGIPEKKRQKVSIDPEKLAELNTAISEAVAKSTVDATFSRIDSLNIISVGCTPDNPNLEFAFTATAEDLISKAGNNLLVSIGKLLGNPVELTETQRTREIDAITPYPSNDRYEIHFRIPEGYTPSPESLEALNIQIANQAGKFMSRARIMPDDASIVQLTVICSMPSAVYHPDKWADVVELLDAATRFSGNALLLTPAK